MTERIKPKKNEEHCITCFRWVPKSRMRKEFGSWKCNPKGHYKNAIECLHLDDEIHGFSMDYYNGGRINWIKPKDRISFGKRQIKKADKWLEEGEISNHEHAKIIYEIREAIE